MATAMWFGEVATHCSSDASALASLLLMAHVIHIIRDGRSAVLCLRQQ